MIVMIAKLERDYASFTMNSKRNVSFCANKDPFKDVKEPFEQYRICSLRAC